MGEWLRNLEQWLQQYDMEVDLAAVWVLSVGFCVYALVKFFSWLQIVSQHDRTSVGRNLKWQKLAEAVMGLAMSTLYSLTLVAYYTGHSFGILERVGLRLFVMAGIVGAVLWGVRFTISLRRENGQA